MFSVPAAAYEVIFHEGFEGDQFPPEGWEVQEFGVFSPGYHSSRCAYTEPVFGANISILRSPPIELLYGETYTLRFYARSYKIYYGYESVRFYLDEDGWVPFSLPGFSYGWREFEETITVPEDTTSSYFEAKAWPYSEEDWFSWYLDGFYVIHTYTAVTPTTLGRIKAAYR